MARVLIIDSDHATLDYFALILTRDGHLVYTATTGHAGLAQARREQLDLAFVDLHLPDCSGLDVLRDLAQTRLHGQCAIVAGAGSGTIRSAIDATRLGAIDYLEKPLCGCQLREIITRAAANRTGVAGPLLHAPAAIRWAKLVMLAVHARTDVPTVEGWCRLSNLARPTLESRCRSLRVSPKASLDFARVLRSLIEARRHGCRPDALLEGDPRTLNRMFRAAGVMSLDDPTHYCEDPARYLSSQQFITDSLAIDAIRAELPLDVVSLQRARGDLLHFRDDPLPRCAG